MRKTIKTVRCRPTKCRNCKKILVVGRQNVEFAKKRSLSVDENEKEVKNGYHPWMKVKKRRKAFIIHGWKWKFAKKRSLSVDEMQKTRKTARHPWMKAKKRRKAESTKIIPDFAQTLWYQESTLTERTLNRELPTNVHTLIFQHTADVFLVCW